MYNSNRPYEMQLKTFDYKSNKLYCLDAYSLITP